MEVDNEEPTLIREPVNKIPRVELENINTRSGLSQQYNTIDDNDVRLTMMENSLREFDILDEAKGSDDYSSGYSNFSSEYDSDLPDNEIDMLLEESLPVELQGQRRVKPKKEVKESIRKLLVDEGTAENVNTDVKEENPHPESSTDPNVHIQCRSKTVLVELEQNHFDLLPEGWIKLMHKSGMPVYLHRKSRVCTMTRPYFLGPGSARYHSIPLSAIPCLHYKRALEKEKKTMESMSQCPGESSSDAHLRKARIETAAENQASQSLESTEVHSYCKSLFHFKTVNSLKYQSWVARRKHEKEKKQEEQKKRLMLPEGTKLLKFPILEPGNGSRPNREWIMNPTGKSYVCILHEYVQHALKKQPTYNFKEIENPGTPYSASVIIDGTEYGSATGASKKLAKIEAAKVALEILIPEMRDKINMDNTKVDHTQSLGLSIFDEIKIEDPRVAEFCAKTTEPSPYAILLTCLQRNHASTEIKVDYTVNNVEHQKNVYRMSVGSHTSTVYCKNKREGKQRASQAILQALHPHIVSWGSLLRLYGNKSVKNVKEKKQEEQEITMLQSKASLNTPNFAILDKLKSEMRKLSEKKKAMKPLGKFIPPDDIDLPSMSSTDLNKISM